MTAEAINQWSGYIFGAITLTAAVYERLRNRKHNESQRVNDAKDELIKSLTADRDSWKSLGEGTTRKFEDYRTTMHEAAKEAQARMLALTAEAERLKSATDLTPLLKAQQEQSAINAEIIASLNAQALVSTKTLQTLDTIQQHLSALGPFKKPGTVKTKRG